MPREIAVLDALVPSLLLVFVFSLLLVYGFYLVCSMVSFGYLNYKFFTH